MRSLLRKALLVALAIVTGLTAVNQIRISILISKVLSFLLFPGWLLYLLISRGHDGSGLEVGLMVSIGLLQLRELARRAAILLSTVPVAILAPSLLIFLGANSRTGREGIAAGYGFLLYGAFLLLLLPLSIWWFVVLYACRSEVSISPELAIRKVLLSGGP